jgi:formate C-acetyltransferase
MAVTDTKKKFDFYENKEIKGFKNLAGLVRGYFDLGGMQVQFNVISNEKLKDAQEHPDKYKDLLIRVAGYSALFVDLDPQIQNDIIERTEHGV